MGRAGWLSVMGFGSSMVFRVISIDHLTFYEMLICRILDGIEILNLRHLESLVLV